MSASAALVGHWQAIDDAGEAEYAEQHRLPILEESNARVREESVGKLSGERRRDGW